MHGFDLVHCVFKVVKTEELFETLALLIFEILLLAHLFSEHDLMKDSYDYGGFEDDKHSCDLWEDGNQLLGSLGDYCNSRINIEVSFLVINCIQAIWNRGFFISKGNHLGLFTTPKDPSQKWRLNYSSVSPNLY